MFSLDDDGAPDAEIGDFLLDVIKSDGAELQELHTDAFLGVTQLEALFAAAPRLQVLNAYLAGQCAMLLPVLRSEPPYGPVRVSALSVFMLFDEDDVEEADVVVDEDEAADVMALAKNVMAAHEALEGLSVSCMNFARGLNALVDAAAQRRVVWLAKENCILDAESVSSLARLLQRGSLKRLVITRCPGFPHAQEESVPVLCAALRACRTLAHLTLQVSPFNGANDRTVTELLDAAAALPALVELDLSGSDVQDTVAFRHALGALLEANLPSLRILVVNNCRLDDDDVEPLLDGLAANTHLLALDCQENNYLSEAFQRDRLAPALEALAARADDDDDVE